MNGKHSASLWSTRQRCSGDLHELCHRFEQAWQAGDEPVIDEFVDAAVREGSGLPVRELLIELVGVDLEWRWRCAAQEPARSIALATTIDHAPRRAGLSKCLPVCPRLEEYVGRYQALGPLDALPIELICHEYWVRHRWGDRPAVEEYGPRFRTRWSQLQEHLEQIRQEFPSEPAEDTSEARETGKGKVEPSVEPSSLPQDFGRYRILNLLGEGGMGSVYLAYDSELDRKVALKVPKFKGEDDQEFIQRFHREARAAAGLRHTNICPVYDVGELAGVHYISMAYIEGRTLAADVGAGRIQSEGQAALLVRKLAAALQEAHAHGVVHRDLKPANIMIDGQDEPVVMDFGLARHLDAQQDTRLTSDGVILGSPAYMSPEQARGEHDRIGPASDIYGLGVILFELLTGRVPFTGPVASVLGQIATQDSPKPSQFRPDLDPRLERVCLKMVALRIEDRYRSMREVVDDLTDYLDGLAGRPRASRLRRRMWGAILVAAATPLVLLGVLLVFRSPHGTVTIEVSEPNLTVSVAGNEYTFQELNKPQHLKAGAHRFAVKLRDATIPLGDTVKLSTGEYNGQYKLAVTLDGAQLTSDRFEILKGDQRVLTIRLERVPTPPPPHPPPPPAGPTASEGTQELATKAGAEAPVMLPVSWPDDAKWQWTELAPMPQPCWLTAAASLGPHVYVVGGESRGAYSFRSEVQRYDIQRDAWEVLSPCPATASRHCLVVYQGKIWLLGGSEDCGTRGNGVFIYDPATDKWSTGPTMLAQRGNHAAVVARDRIYCLGGGKQDVRCEYYDPAEERFLWGPILRQQHGCNAVRVGDKMIVVFSSGEVDALDLKTHAITALPTVPVENRYIWPLDRNGFAFTYQGHLLLLQWPGLGPDQPARMYRLDLTTGKWVPLPFRADQVDDQCFYAAVQDDAENLYLIGGKDGYFNEPAFRPVSAQVWRGRLTAKAEGRVLLEERFAGMGDRLGPPWRTYLEGWAVDKSELHIHIDTGYGSAYALRPADGWQDYAIECEFRHEQAALGFIFRLDEAQREFYCLNLTHAAEAGVIREEPRARLWRCQFSPATQGVFHSPRTLDPKEATLRHDVHLTLGECEYTAPPDRYHHLRIEVVGKSMRALLDGVLLLAAEDPTDRPIVAGGIGLMATNRAFQPCQAAIKNLRIVALRNPIRQAPENHPTRAP